MFSERSEPSAGVTVDNGRRLQDPGGEAGACAHDHSAERRSCRCAVAHRRSDADTRQVQRSRCEDEAHHVDQWVCRRRSFRAVRMPVCKPGHADE